MSEPTFSDLGIDSAICRSLDAEGYINPTPIQARAIPILLQGKDLLGIAQTGTGKTAAFSLPILQQLASHGAKPAPRKAHALILAPTRELVVQISESLKTYGRHLKLSQTVIMGGVAHRGQIRAMARGVDVLVATPGRLVELMEAGSVDLSSVRHFVLDEADRMLDMGFIRDIRKITKALPRTRQTLLFSATMPGEIAKLAGDILQAPERIEIASKSVAVERIEQQVHHVAAGEKPATLRRLLDDQAMGRVIVFTRTKRGANKVAQALNAANVPADAIHGNKSQNARQRALESFKSGAMRVLVATDIAARGIDVDNVSHVINYELPDEPETYVHRIGRTARAGSDGIAIVLCDAGERSRLRAIERLIKRPLSIVGDGPSGPEIAPEPRKRGGQRGGGAAGGRGQRPNGGQASAKPRGQEPRRSDTKRAGEAKRPGDTNRPGDSRRHAGQAADRPRAGKPGQAADRPRGGKQSEAHGASRSRSGKPAAGGRWKPRRTTRSTDQAASR